MFSVSPEKTRAWLRSPVYHGDKYAATQDELQTHASIGRCHKASFGLDQRRPASAGRVDAAGLWGIASDRAPLLEQPASRAHTATHGSNTRGVSEAGQPEPEDFSKPGALLRCRLDRDAPGAGQSC